MKCKNCQKDFEITDADKEFYAKIEVSEPTSCPDCRRQQRLAWRCERSLYFRKCDLCGRQHMSSYKPNAPFPVYCLDCWYSDKWDKTANARDYDLSLPFFEQFAELQKSAPRGSLFITRGTVFNSDYINASTGAKNCYLSFSLNGSEDCYYCNFAVKSFNACQCSELFNSEKCYDCVSCDQCYGLVGCTDCRDCRDSAFLLDCHGCHDCFGCWNLRNQKFCLWNKQLSEEEYRGEISKIDLRSRTEYEKAKNKLEELKNQGVYKYYHGNGNVNCTGDYIIRCKNAQECFDCNDLEDCKYVTRFVGAKDCYDVDHFGWGGMELVYFTVSTGVNSTNIKFCNQVWNSSHHMEYCDYCPANCQNCFGCIGLTDKKYCILNKQYEEKEYFNLRNKIIEQMKADGEYGQFFPVKLSHVPYTDSLAQDYYPLTKEKALELGFRWEDEDRRTVPATASVPDSSVGVDLTITKETFVCSDCSRNYKIIPQELHYYQEMSVPLPQKCFECYIQDRIHRKNSRRLYHRQCMNEGCINEFETTYDLDRPEKVYCEECYQKEIY